LRVIPSRLMTSPAFLRSQSGVFADRDVALFRSPPARWASNLAADRFGS
jgi:hypothetical protein